MSAIPEGYSDLFTTKKAFANLATLNADGTPQVTHIDSLAKKYLGQDRYPYRKQDEVRVIFTITPDRVQTVG
jgi:hypothetical protein